MSFSTWIVKSFFSFFQFLMFQFYNSWSLIFKTWSLTRTSTTGNVRMRSVGPLRGWSCFRRVSNERRDSGVRRFEQKGHGIRRQIHGTLRFLQGIAHESAPSVMPLTSILHLQYRNKPAVDHCSLEESAAGLSCWVHFIHLHSCHVLSMCYMASEYVSSCWYS